MTAIYTAHLVGLALTFVISLGVVWWIRRRTRDRAGSVMIVLQVAHAVMVTCAAGQLLSSSQSLKAFWWHSWYALVIVLPVIWFVFAVYYTGREYWLTPPVWLALGTSVVVPGGLVLTNPVHGLLATGFGLELEPFPQLVVAETTGLLRLGALTHLYALTTLALLFRQFLFSRRTARLQTGAVLAGMGPIIFFAYLTQTDALPVARFPYGVFGAGIFSGIIAIGLFKNQSFAVAPLARDRLFESLGDAVLVVDANRTVVDFNRTAAELFPALEDCLGQCLDDAYPSMVVPEPRAADDGGDASIQSSDEPLESPFAERLHVSIDGETRTLRIDTTEISSGGEPRGYALIVRDVTELERHAQELEHRTQQLERFASVLSHDLRNPVSVATGYAELALETGEVDHVRETMTALERIEETIGDLLTLTREEAAIDQQEAVALRSVVDDAWGTSDTGVATLENDIDPVRIRADPSRLRSLFENLFRNAVDHGAETVRVGPLETETGAGVYVSDDGPGIPADDRDRVFEYGYSTRDEGTGIGLAVVKSIATAHGWSLSVTDGEPGGARFEVTEIEPVPAATTG
ncbi:histidine kinase N-terminal 7TM domain-containing protein [Haloterrigena salifodinae]|uniref:histidine kinase N-terminal 7TM domain-containing protein n=1 Tax=Haloterrigena salifodinae TaxID=2675099 RepID=UPI000F89BB78|nr:histidine kinase N-terminal 7TM domain-containing protein [Haloterrigena salifodinae]